MQHGFEAYSPGGLVLGAAVGSCFLLVGNLDLLSKSTKKHYSPTKWSVL